MPMAFTSEQMVLLVTTFRHHRSDHCLHRLESEKQDPIWRYIAGESELISRCRPQSQVIEIIVGHLLFPFFCVAKHTIIWNNIWNCRAWHKKRKQDTRQRWHKWLAQQTRHYTTVDSRNDTKLLSSSEPMLPNSAALRTVSRLVHRHFSCNCSPSVRMWS